MTTKTKTKDTKTKPPTRVTLECGHSHIQTRHVVEPAFPPPKVGCESLCWGFRCLCFRKIVKVEPVTD